jgi:hypothetical protein
MTQRVALLAWLFIAGYSPAITASPWNDSPQEKSSAPKSAPKAAPKAAQASLAGCIDQAADGKFILIEEKTRETVATLVAEGFPNEGFAKHLGQKVTVRGIASPAGSSPEFRVRSIAVISDQCAAQ